MEYYFPQKLNRLCIENAQLNIKLVLGQYMRHQSFCSETRREQYFHGTLVIITLYNLKYYVKGHFIKWVKISSRPHNHLRSLKGGQRIFTVWKLENTLHESVVQRSGREYKINETRGLQGIDRLKRESGPIHLLFKLLRTNLVLSLKLNTGRFGEVSNLLMSLYFRDHIFWFSFNHGGYIQV